MKTKKVKKRVTTAYLKFYSEKAEIDTKPDDGREVILEKKNKIGLVNHQMERERIFQLLYFK